jgi:hypothetical protein
LLLLRLETLKLETCNAFARRRPTTDERRLMG